MISQTAFWIMHESVVDILSSEKRQNCVIGTIQIGFQPKIWVMINVILSKSFKSIKKMPQSKTREPEIERWNVLWQKMKSGFGKKSIPRDKNWWTRGKVHQYFFQCQLSNGSGNWNRTSTQTEELDYFFHTSTVKPPFNETYFTMTTRRFDFTLDFLLMMSYKQFYRMFQNSL